MIEYHSNNYINNLFSNNNHSCSEHYLLNSVFSVSVQVDKHFVKNNKKSMVKENGDDLDTSISILEKILNPHDFASNNRLKVIIYYIQ